MNLQVELRSWFYVGLVFEAALGGCGCSGAERQARAERTLEVLLVPSTASPQLSSSTPAGTALSQDLKHGQAPPEASASPAALGDRRVSKAINLLELLVAGRKDASVNHVASLVGLSASRLRQLFRLEQGVSFSEHCRRVRLDHAGRLLLTTCMSVKEIAWAAGYKNSPPFVRQFAKTFGETPGKYRQQYGAPVDLALEGTGSITAEKSIQLSHSNEGGAS